MYLKALVKYGMPILIFCAIVYGIYHYGYGQGLEEGSRLKDLALTEQQTKLTETCKKNQQITATIEDTNAKATAIIDAEFNDSIMRDQRQGLSVTNVTTQTEHTEAATAKPTNGNGRTVESIKLRLFAKKAEKYRVDLNSCLDYVDAIEALQNNQQ